MPTWGVYSIRRPRYWSLSELTFSAYALSGLASTMAVQCIRWNLGQTRRLWPLPFFRAPHEWVETVQALCSGWPQAVALPPASSDSPISLLTVPFHRSNPNTAMAFRGYKYTPGAYIQVNCPAISASEWHPFSLFPVPGPRAMAGFYVDAVRIGIPLSLSPVSMFQCFKFFFPRFRSVFSMVAVSVGMWHWLK